MQAGPVADAAVLDELKRELSRLLSEYSPDGRHVAASSLKELPRTRLRHAGGVLWWYSELPGDYDQNGEVNAADLIPLSQQLGTRSYFYEDSLEFLLDGDGNREINIGDVVPIARNFGRNISGWEIYRSSSPDDYPADGNEPGPTAELLGIPPYAAIGEADERRRQEFSAELLPGFSYWLAPVADGQALHASNRFTLGTIGNTQGIWNMFAADPQQSRHSWQSGPRSGEIRWSAKLFNNASEATFDSAGNAYVYDLQNDLYSFDMQGNVNWAYPHQAHSFYGPTIAMDGTVYLGIGTSRITALSPNGEELFKTATGRNEQIWGAPAINADGRLVFSANDGFVYMLNPDGTFFSETDASMPSGLSLMLGPCISPDGTILVQRNEATLLYFDEAGQLKRDWNWFNRAITIPSAGADGRIYIANWERNYLYCLDDIGRTEWKDEQHQPDVVAIAVSRSGRIVTGNRDNRLVSYLPDGTVQWELELAGPVGTPLIDADEYVYVSGVETGILSIDPAGQVAWNYMPADSLPARLSISPDGSLFACADEGYVTVFGERISPRDFTASDGTYQEEVHLQWAGLPDASGYGIEYRSADGGSPLDWTQLAETAGPDAAQFRHTQDAPAGNEAVLGNQYEYRVRALYAGTDPGPWTEPDNGGMQENWTKWGHDLRNSNQALVDGPTSNKRRWSYSGIIFNHSCPVVGRDGTIYIGSQDSFLYAINPDGSLKWKFQAAERIHATPAIGPDGTVYFGDYGGGFFAVNPDGSEKWSRHGIGILAGPVVRRDGSIVSCDFGDYLKIHQPAGDWYTFLKAGASLSGTPAVGSDDTVYVASREGVLTAVSPDNEISWTFDAPGQIFAPPVLAGDDTIYVNCDGEICAVSPQGQQLWITQSLDVIVHDRLALGLDGNIRVLDTFGTMKTVSPAGDFIGEVELPGVIFSDFSMDASGVIYYGCEDGTVYAVNPDGSVVWSYHPGQTVYCTPTIGPDGTLYVGSEDGRLYAFGS